MRIALFISDLHGSKKKYNFLFTQILAQKPAAVFIAGDLTGMAAEFDSKKRSNNFFTEYLSEKLRELKQKMKKSYPQIFVILGNDDPKTLETELIHLTETELLVYVNEKIVDFEDYKIAGYSYVPPTPFLNKDWEKFDVSRFVDVGCVSPEYGYRSSPIDKHELRHNTIKRDLDRLFQNDFSRTIFLFHAPPYQTNLDRADLEGKFIDHAPLDIHVGSIAIKEFIMINSPYITLHGHIHESTRLTGNWRQKIGNSFCFQGALERNETGIIMFDLDNPENAEMIMD